MSSEPITADNLRDYVDYWVVKKGNRSTQIVHLPAPDSTPDAPEPVCEDRELEGGRSHGWAGWKVKSPAVYPSGYVSLCERCSTVMKRDSSIFELNTD